MMPQKFDKYIKFFRALASEERIEILRLLQKNNEMYAQDVEKNFFMEQSTASHHLNTLLKAGIVKTRKQGRNIYYSLRKDNIKAVFEEFLRQLETA